MKHFELERHILEAWRVTDDIKLMAEGGASAADFAGLATLYDLKYQQMWAAYEQVAAERANNYTREDTELESASLELDGNPIEIRSFAFTDDANQQIKLGYGDYGEGSGWILGVDGDNEQVSIQLKDLNVFINLLKKLAV
jgi:hypothetical protein